MIQVNSIRIGESMARKEYSMIVIFNDVLNKTLLKQSFNLLF